MEFHGFDDADAAVAVEKVRSRPCGAPIHMFGLTLCLPICCQALPSSVPSSCSPAPLSPPSCQAREAVRQAEAEELPGEDAAGGSAARREERVPMYLQPQERERWDCESILR